MKLSKTQQQNFIFLNVMGMELEFLVGNKLPTHLLEIYSSFYNSDELEKFSFIQYYMSRMTSFVECFI